MGQSPYFGEYVKAQLIDQLGAKRVFGGGFRVDTTIDLRLQKLARDAIDKWLPSPTGPQAALVAINPSTGAVLAMYGGRSFHASQFNLAVQGERQPGSSFKPFVLATALKEGISPLSTFVSKPVSIFLGNKYWNVHNFEGEYLGPIDLVKATAASDNSVFAQLTKVVGPANVARTAHELGITSHLDGVFSIGLGTQAVNPLEMARAYATFANGGYNVSGKVFANEPRAITTIRDVNGDLVYNNTPARKRVMSSVDAAIVTQLLEGVVTGGTGTAAALPEPAGGRQDGHHRELRRRMVRRLHAAARHCGLGRVPEGPPSDAHRVPRPRGRGRNVPGGDLEVVHAAGADACSARSRRVSPCRRISRLPRSASPTATVGPSSTTDAAAMSRCSSTSRVAGRRRPRTAR